MKLKDYKPKYQTLELMFDDNNIFKLLGSAQLIPYDVAVSKYGYMEIASIRNYDDTQSTSIILKKVVH